MSNRKSQTATLLETLGIHKEQPVNRVSLSGEGLSDEQLTALLEKGDPLTPEVGRLQEDPATLTRLFAEFAPRSFEIAVFLPSTPDGRLARAEACDFDALLAVRRIIALHDAKMSAEDKCEAQAYAWLPMAYHDHDHPADFGCITLDATSGRIKCVYLDVKETEALQPGSQRTKLELRACERKFGCIAQTVTDAKNGGFANYPGRGLPGMMITVLVNPISGGKKHSGFAVGWFFGVRSNYQANAAVWGWGGTDGVRLPPALMTLLDARRVTIGGQTKSLLDLLREFRSFDAFRNEKGVWNVEKLQYTLLAKHLAGRFIIMHENPLLHLPEILRNLQPPNVETRLSPEDFVPGESFATYFGRKADAAIADSKAQAKGREEAVARAEAAEKQRDDVTKERDVVIKERDVVIKERDVVIKERDESKSLISGMISWLRQEGRSEAEIAKSLGLSVEELRLRFPPPV